MATDGNIRDFRLGACETQGRVAGLRSTMAESGSTFKVDSCQAWYHNPLWAYAETNVHACDFWGDRLEIASDDVGLGRCVFRGTGVDSPSRDATSEATRCTPVLTAP